MAFAKKKMDEKVLDVNASMSGTMAFKDPINLRINGKFEGNLDTRGNLTIGSTAVVSGDIKGDTVIVGGRVKGQITAREELVLLSSAVIEGDIFPYRLTVESGSIFQGKCSMLGEVFSVNDLSRYLDVENSSILEWANAGKIPAVKQGNDWAFERKAIDSWVASGKIGK